MKPNTISTKIKLIGIFFIILMTSIIITTIYLNEKKEKVKHIAENRKRKIFSIFFFEF